MTTTLEEMQAELLPSLTAETGVVFGIGADVSTDDEGFIPPDDEWNTEDEPNPRRGGTSHGRDTLEGALWQFNLHVDREDRYEALETLATFKTAWRALHIRQTPSAVLPLRYKLGNRVRRVYGRPRRFSAPPSNRIMDGYIPITCDFSQVDNFTYDDEMAPPVILPLNSGSSGGFVFPLEFPFTTLPVGLSQQDAVVGGDADTYPVIRFNGPVTNPELVTDDWTMGLDMTIGASDYVEIDLRPWAMTALLNGQSSVAGALGRRTYMAGMKFSPGNHTMLFRGSALSSSATCEVRWNNAYNSI